MFWQIFAKNAPLLDRTPEQLGVMSIDTLEREWDLLGEQGLQLIVRSKLNPRAFMIGTQMKREDGKFCINCDYKIIYDAGRRVDRFEFWNLTQVQQTQRMHQLMSFMEANWRELA